MKEKFKLRKFLSPVITIMFLIIIVSVLSLIFEKMSIDGNVTSIVNGKLEKSIVVVRSIISKEGIIYFLSNLTNNFNMLQEVVLIIVGLFVTSILDSSGILNQIFSPLRRVKSKFITFLFVFIGILSTIFLDYGYILLIPLVPVIYKYLNKSPILGVITIFLAIALGYGGGLIYSYTDFSLGSLTTLAATIDVDPTYRYSLTSNIYITLTCIILISLLVTYLIEKHVSKRVVSSEILDEEFKTSGKALIISLISGIVLLAIIFIGMLPGGILLDNTQSSYLAKMFSNNAPFSLAFVYIVLLICSVVATIYGFISKNFIDSNDFTLGLTKQFNNVGYLFVLLFLSSILTSIIDYTNIGTVFVSKLMYLIEVFDFTGIPLIVVTFILICLMSLVMPNSLEKWTLISPTLVPIFMRANIAPDYTQFLFALSDSIGRSLSLVFVYFIIMLGFVQKYNKDNSISLFDIFKRTMPIVLTMTVFFIVLLVIWYISGLPLGIGTYATM